LSDTPNVKDALNETAKTHGLDGTLVAPDWASLQLSEVRTLLAAFPDAGEPIEILSCSPRPFSSASVVRTTTEKIFVKRHARAVRDIEGLMEEHRFMDHLRGSGIAVPRIFAAGSGSTAVESADSTYEVHAIPPGLDLYEDAISWTPFHSMDHARSAGAMLAHLHLAAEGFCAPARNPRPLVASFSIFAAQDAAEGLAKYLALCPTLEHDAQTLEDCSIALDLLAPFHDELKPLLPALNPLWTQNDLHGSNLFWSDRSVHAHATSVIDFGLSDRTNAVYDIAQAIERNIVEWLKLTDDRNRGDDIPVHLDQLWALLEGYEQQRPLSLIEAAALAPMLALCHAEFALTEADYFLGILHSPEKARVATHDYLVGHAEWFRGSGRRKILDPLRQWAETRQKRAMRS
jgi:Ser/Thr protein kinase RdoA (MazF antagonist)